MTCISNSLGRVLEPCFGRCCHGYMQRAPVYHIYIMLYMNLNFEPFCFRVLCCDLCLLVTACGTSGLGWSETKGQDLHGPECGGHSVHCHWSAHVCACLLHQRQQLIIYHRHTDIDVNSTFTISTVNNTL